MVSGKASGGAAAAGAGAAGDGKHGSGKYESGDACVCLPPDAPIVRRALRSLQRIAVATGYLQGGQEVPLPAKVVATTWSSNERTRGAYSYLPRGCEWSDNEMLAAPLGISAASRHHHRVPEVGPADSSPAMPPQLLFIGEACDSEMMGSVHGAMMSGVRAAERMDCL